jgi:hypothetical protein
MLNDQYPHVASGCRIGQRCFTYVVGKLFTIYVVGKLFTIVHFSLEHQYSEPPKPYRKPEKVRFAASQDQRKVVLTTTTTNSGGPDVRTVVKVTKGGGGGNRQLYSCSGAYHHIFHFLVPKIFAILHFKIGNF